MKDTKIYAWYFPNWHPTPLNDGWHGKNWTEWEVVKCARPRFDGHYQPRVPLWGYEDESDPNVFAKKINTAKKYGLDGFIFDFYWFKDLGPYRRDCLDNGFLKAENNEECEFSVMWCNHDPIYAHPAPYKFEGFELASGDVDEEFFREVTDFCIENYFPKNNYQTVEGKKYFGIWNIGKMVDNFGSAEEFGKILEDFRGRAKKAGFEVYISACRTFFPGFNDKNKELFEKVADILKIDSLFDYDGGVHDPKITSFIDWPKVEYSIVRDRLYEKAIEDEEFSKVPLEFGVSVGWDVSPRTVQSDMYENRGYPFSPIAINATPDELFKTFTMARKYIESGKSRGKMLTIACWNEWTEGSYLEPDEKYGYGALEALKKAFDK